MPGGEQKSRARPQLSWQEVRVRFSLTDEGRRLKREMRRLGAVLFWLAPGELRAVWPRGQEARRALDRLEELVAPDLLRWRRFSAPDPRSAWRSPQPDWITPELGLAPAWARVPAGPRVVVIDALTAFGAGDHPSTRLNLLLLARLRKDGWRPRPGAWLADVGTGTGVLALGMGLLFENPVLALDPDPASRRAVRRNRALNPLAAPRVHFVLGTHLCLGGRFPLMAANLPEPLLCAVLECLAHCLEPGGRLVVSGFRSQAAAGVEEVGLKAGLFTADRAEQLGWSGLVLVRE